MIEEEMKVGPKGQVVIPRALRKALKIHPGSKVVFTLEGDRIVLKKPKVDSVAIMERIARKGPSIKLIAPHLYEEELSERT
ncbi:MAG: AbrB/MazE/SpoVT family DNA-binding domain-containing protein [Thaumarchaeota archaeon]|nr:AbrB/MazE/SpoVT family DNA-binding domain-containing protein [Nitrososphaerota archaeon]